MRSEESDRLERSRRRRERATVSVASLDAPQADPDRIEGAAAVSLLTRLSRESWSLTGPTRRLRSDPSSSRAVIELPVAKRSERRVRQIRVQRVAAPS